MREIPKYGMSWLMKMLLSLICIFIFQSSIIPVSASSVVLDQNHHIGISEIYTYDEIETGSAQTALSLAIRSGIQASMVGTYMQSAMLPTSSATNSGRELGVGNESISSNNLAANDLYACTTCPREVNEGNGNKKTLTPAQKIDYTISESKSKFDALQPTRVNYNFFIRIFEINTKSTS